jgi:hypothetical protein
MHCHKSVLWEVGAPGSRKEISTFDFLTNKANFRSAIEPCTAPRFNRNQAKSLFTYLLESFLEYCPRLLWQPWAALIDQKESCMKVNQIAFWDCNGLWIYP